MATPTSSLSSQNNYASLKNQALKLINQFKQVQNPVNSVHYSNVARYRVAHELGKTVNNPGEINQVHSSLCGPAAFFFSLAETRPDMYVSLVIDLFNNGHAKIGTIDLQSSIGARKYPPTHIRQSDWMLLSSIKPNYDHPNEQFDGITLPGKLKQWFKDTGYSQVTDKTNIFSNKGIQTLLEAHNDQKNGFTVCLFVDADVFEITGAKIGASMFPNHWVVLNSDIKIREYDEKNKQLKPPVNINKPLADLIEKEISHAKYESFSSTDIYKSPNSKPIESEDRIILSAFTWGDPLRPVYNRTNKSQKAKLYYFLRGFYGYVKAKW